MAECILIGMRQPLKGEEWSNNTWKQALSQMASALVLLLRHCNFCHIALYYKATVYGHMCYLIAHIIKFIINFINVTGFFSLISNIH